MTLEKRTSPYEIFIRLNGNGFVAAHYGELAQFVEDGIVTHEQELPVRPITQAECGQYIGETGAQLIEAADTARAQVAILAAENEQLRAALSALAPDTPPA